MRVQFVTIYSLDILLIHFMLVLALREFLKPLLLSARLKTALIIDLILAEPRCHIGWADYTEETRNGVRHREMVQHH